MTVEVEDQFGNLVTTDNSSVTLSVASGPGSRRRHIDRDGQQRHRHLQQPDPQHRRQLYADCQRRQSDAGQLQQLHCTPPPPL